MKLTLPLPPSANRNWRSGKGNTYQTKEAKQYKADVYLIGFSERVKPLDGDVIVTARFYRKRKIGDLDNYTKIFLDALKGVAFFDDSQVIETHFYRRDDKTNPRVEVEVLAVTTAAGAVKV